MSDFSTTTTLDIEVPSSELRNVRQQIEESLSEIEVGLADGSSMSAQAAGGDDTRTGRERRRRRREYRWARQRTSDIEDILKAVRGFEPGGGGGEGGGILGGILDFGTDVGGEATGAGALTTAAGALSASATALTGSATAHGGAAAALGGAAGALSAAAASFPDSTGGGGGAPSTRRPSWAPLTVQRPGWLPLSVEDVGPLGVRDPSPLSVSDPSPLSVSDPSPLSVTDPSPLTVDNPSPLTVDDSIEPIAVDAPESIPVRISGERPVESPTDGGGTPFYTPEYIEQFGDEVPIAGHLAGAVWGAGVDIGARLPGSKEGAAPFLDKSELQERRQTATEATIDVSVDHSPTYEVDIDPRQLDALSGEVVDAVERGVRRDLDELKRRVEDLESDVDRLERSVTE